MAFLIAFLVMSAVMNSLHDDLNKNLIKSGERESGNSQVEEFQSTIKPRHQCFEGISITQRTCPWFLKRQMWTFNENLKMCEEKTGDGCNIYGGNIFKTEGECNGTCLLAPIMETTKPPYWRCVIGTGSTNMYCGNDHVKQIWTFNQKQNQCVTITVDTCNHHFGNIFKTESECIGTCVLAPIIETSKPAPIRRCVTGAIGSTRKGCDKSNVKQMWTYNEEQNKCLTTTVDGCNHHWGNIFETKGGCIHSCVSP